MYVFVVQVCSLLLYTKSLKIVTIADLRACRWFANLSYEQDWHQTTRSDNSLSIEIFLVGSYKQTNNSKIV